jgi:hypothetical protein
VAVTRNGQHQWRRGPAKRASCVGLRRQNAQSVEPRWGGFALRISQGTMPPHSTGAPEQRAVRDSPAARSNRVGVARQNAQGVGRETRIVPPDVERAYGLGQLRGIAAGRPGRIGITGQDAQGVGLHQGLRRSMGASRPVARARRRRRGSVLRGPVLAAPPLRRDRFRRRALQVRPGRGEAGRRLRAARLFPAAGPRTACRDTAQGCERGRRGGGDQICRSRS